MNKYKCPCCGNLTLDEDYSQFGTFEICPVCFYEVDDILTGGGANKFSLEECKENYKKFGAVEERLVQYVRKPYLNEISRYVT
jgi:hypothetical protein